MYKDLREFIAEVEALGALRRIDGADPRYEIGGITEVAAGLPECPALLFPFVRRIVADLIGHPMFELLVQLVQIIKQARILGGDDGLGGEVFQQLDLFRRTTTAHRLQRIAPL